MCMACYGGNSKTINGLRFPHGSLQDHKDHYFSLRNGFTAYSALSPVNGSFATVAAQDQNPSQLDASTAASGPHDFAVRLSHTRQSQLSRPSHLTARS